MSTSGFSSGIASPDQISTTTSLLPTPSRAPTPTIKEDMDIASSLEYLQTDEQRRVLDTVAKIRKCGLEGDLSLPQLVVCGDQSAGKSSVLEALTEIPFPRNDNLCTRFATEIILRRAVVDSLTIKVIPDSDRPTSEKAAIKNFQRSITNFDELPDVMEAAMEVMGISGSGSDNEARAAFAKDVLSIEIEGPTRPQLTVVDIPGLIATATKGVTDDDVDLVAEITHDYISKPRTICLAVVSAATDYANQKILKKVREVDPEGNRTVGIITKPDRIEGSGSKQAFLELAQNQDIYFKLGWHVLKNRSAAERDCTLGERKRSEAKWFREDVFKVLPLSCVGIDSLRKRLSVLLFEHVKRELPHLRAELDKALQDAQAQLDVMGSGRSTAAECKDYLTQLFIAHQEVCKAAVNGHYEGIYFQTATAPAHVDPSDLHLPELRRTRAIVQHLNTEFTNHLRENGHQYHIDMSKDTPLPKYMTFPPHQQPSTTNKPIRLTKSEALYWVRSLLIGSRGKELGGNFNPLLIGELFWAQCSKWKNFATDHLENVADVCSSFLRSLLEDTCPKDVQDRVWECIRDELKKRKAAADEELKKIMTDLASYPINYNHYYTDTINKRRQERQKEVLTKCIEAASTRNAVESFDGTVANTTNIDTEQVIASFHRDNNADMEKFACEEALDCLFAIYKVSVHIPTSLTLPHNPLVPPSFHLTDLIILRFRKRPSSRTSRLRSSNATSCEISTAFSLLCLSAGYRMKMQRPSLRSRSTHNVRELASWTRSRS